jgi:hypothetical protein
MVGRCLLLCALLAGCARDAPAPVTSCFSSHRPVVIEGATQRGLSTYCTDENGRMVLRPDAPPQR